MSANFKKVVQPEDFVISGAVMSTTSLGEVVLTIPAGGHATVGVKFALDRTTASAPLGVTLQDVAFYYKVGSVALQAFSSSPTLDQIKYADNTAPVTAVVAISLAQFDTTANTFCRGVATATAPAEDVAQATTDISYLAQLVFNGNASLPSTVTLYGFDCDYNSVFIDA